MEEAAVAGTHAAVAFHFSYLLGHEEHGASEVWLFDLQTAQSALGEWVDCPSGGTCEIDQLVLGSDAVSAVHTIQVGGACTCTVEQIQASDSTGRNNTLDSVSEPEGSPPALTNLTLTGDTLTWEHNGTPRSAQLQPESRPTSRTHQPLALGSTTSTLAVRPPAPVPAAPATDGSG